MIRPALVLALMGLPLCARTLEECTAAKNEGRLADAKQCFAALTESSDPYVRAEALWGAGKFRGANEQFKQAVARRPQSADHRVRWGRLFLERSQAKDAAALFEEALSIQPKHAGALVGLALVAAERFDMHASQLAKQALQQDSKLVEAHELLARLALEEGDEKRAAVHAEDALKIDPNAQGAMAVHAATGWLKQGSGSPWIERIAKLNPACGEAYAFAAHFLILNRRYEEGVALYRKALELNPDLWNARAELGINLMRTGRDAEAREQLELCYENGFHSDATVNSLRLLDSYKNYATIKTPRAVLKLHKKEAAVLRPYFAAEVERAIATYEKKYRFKLEQPVQVEVYPDHEDFAVRTMGMPGLGALGVTFGYVVAMDSPSGRKRGTFHWASTLWHELSHVFVLSATKHKVPRWFTEGMAVHEETAASPDWGDRLDVHTVRAIKEKKLLPITDLDRGFVHPSYPAQVTVSYYQAGRICDFITQKWGADKLLTMMRSFGGGQETSSVIKEALGKPPEQFDKDFLSWLDSGLAGTLRGFDEWEKRFAALRKASKAGDPADVIREGRAIRDLYPEYIEAGSVYEILAEALLARGDKRGATAELEMYAKFGGKNPDAIKKLAQLLEELGRKEEAAGVLTRFTYVDPLDESVHVKLGSLLLSLGRVEDAIREYRVVLGLNPLDRAESQFNLARAYRQANKMEEAREHLFLALESAPGYKPAQKMLLELNDREFKP